MNKISGFLAAFCLLLSFSVLAADRYGDMTKDDQKFFQNDYGAGNNQRERIDKDVIEINKLHGEINGLKAEVNQLKEEVEKLKKGK